MKKISDAELEVMKVIWKKREITSLEIIEKLKCYKWKHNTIRTLINRLVMKKAVGISKKDGKKYSYVPLIKENEYKRARVKQFLKQLFDNSIEDFILFLKKEDNEYYNEICNFLKTLNDE